MNAKDVESLCRALFDIARAVTPTGAPYKGRGDASVASLTEAGIYCGDGLYAIADALTELRDAIASGASELADAGKDREAGL
jgi:hypothetical protein